VSDFNQTENPGQPEFPGDLIPLQYHFNMLSDPARMGGFVKAIEMAVQPGMRVLELGAGTGVLSFLAARRGAKDVWAIEYLPHVFKAAQTALATNKVDDVVHLVQGDARNFLPPEPVDVVICEMLHVGLLREKQAEVIGGFKQRYLEKFGALPVFIPEATLQAVQLVFHDFDYYGYRAETPVFQDPTAIQERTKELSDPFVFQQFAYDENIPEVCAVDQDLVVTTSGQLNAVRIITKNILASSTTDRSVA
jgi:protein arginine N-methyltransferase 1